MGKIALVPLDARPVTRDLPVQIASIGGWDVLVPSKEWLGHLKNPGNTNEIISWLTEVSEEADAFVISCDMLGYGGLVPSRVSTQTERKIKSNLQVIRSLKNRFPQKRIFAFSMTMRISNSNDKEEEKEYWSEYGKLIWTCSYHTHRFEVTGEISSAEAAKQAREAIPVRIWQDYVETRARGFSINQWILGLAQEGIIDFLVYPQDDTSEYGMNIQEQQKTRELIHHYGLGMKVLVYPGAEEVSSTLITRLLNEAAGRRPKFFPIYSGIKGPFIRALYEDRPIGESVEGHIFAAGGMIVDHPDQADIILAVNTPGKGQGDMMNSRYLSQVNTADRNIPAFIDRIKYYLLQGNKVGVADLAYAHGVDPVFYELLKAQVEITRLAGFAGWNTAGNTLGTCIGQICCRLADDYSQKSHMELLMLRIADDYLYQSVVRPDLNEWLETHNLTIGQLKDEVERRLKPLVEGLHRQLFACVDGISYSLSIEDIYQPWHRTCEIGLDFQLMEHS